MTGGLAGKQIVNTRAVHQAQALSDLLRQHDAVPLEYPCIAITPPQETSALDAALRDLLAGGFDWLLLTSANTVFAIAERLKILERTFAGTRFRVAAVGAATAETARRQLGLEIADLPPEYTAEALADHLPIGEGSRVLLPQSAFASPTLAQRLTARGANVTLVTAYQTMQASGGVLLSGVLAAGRIDAITFTSPSTVTYFLQRLEAEGGQATAAVHQLPAACIGAKTAAAAQHYGFRRLAVAPEQTLAGLIAALEMCFSHDHPAPNTSGILHEELK